MFIDTFFCNLEAQYDISNTKLSPIPRYRKLAIMASMHTFCIPKA